MAITFSKSISTAELLPAFNNNIVEFSSGLSNPTHAIINVSGNDYKIYPDSSGVFWYNFKFLFSKLVNDDNFSDNVTLTVDDNAQIDNDLFISLLFTYTVYDDTTNETTSETYTILKQALQYKDSNLVITTNSFTTIQDIDFTYWVGYPFDITFYKDTGEACELRDAAAGILTYQTLDGINRLSIDDGSDNIDNQLFAWSDYLQIVSASDSINFTINKIDDCSGTYIKWLYNGAWYYWLFNEKKKEDVSVKDLGSVFNDFENQDETISPYISKGKTGVNKKRLHATGLSKENRNILSTIIDSPKVYLFTGTQGTAATLNDWLEVDVKTRNFTSNNYGKNVYNTVIDIEYNLNTMTL